MRQLTLVALCLVSIPAAAGAQPRHGNLVFSVGDSSLQSGYTGYTSTLSPGTFSTLAVAPAGSFHNWVRMAPNNTDLVFTRVGLGGTPLSDLVNLQPNGAQTTLAHFPAFGPDGYELDHDGKWVLSAKMYPTSPRQSFVCGVDHVSRTITTFTSLTTTTYFNEMTIDRDPGSMPYAVATCCLNGTNGPEILKTDRKGTIVTLVGGSNLNNWYAIELDPRTGDYIGQIDSHIIRMDNKTGKWTTLTAFFGNGIKIMQDDTAWLAGATSTNRTFLRYDLSQNALLTIIPSPSPWSLMSVEVYGSRPLVCNQKTSTTVTVNVQSRHPLAGGKLYALAASLARRPGIGPFPNGEYLNLDTTSSLFYPSALGALPSIFQNFQGTLNSSGNAGAQVNIPKVLPYLGITVFVAGVIFGPKLGVIQVTNTHWFVL